MHIGQIVPASPIRGITHGPDMPPVWHPLIVQAHKMRSCRERLKAAGVFAFYPAEEVTRHYRGKIITTERAFVTGWVYAQFRQPPQFDVMQERGLILGVFCIDAVPIIIHPDVIRHLQGMTVEAAKLREARAEMMRIKPGDNARVMHGPWAGHMIEVTDVRGGVAWYNSLAGFKGTARIDALEKVFNKWLAFPDSMCI